MRVVHLTDQLHLGSERMAVDLASAQAARGHAVVLASAGGCFEPLLSVHGVTHVRIGRRLANPWSASGAMIRLAGVCRWFRPDVVHAHTTAGAVLGYLSVELAGGRLVTTVHDPANPSSAMRLGARVVAGSVVGRSLLQARGFDARRIDVVPGGSIGSSRRDVGATAATGPVLPPGRYVTTVCDPERDAGVQDLILGFADAVTAAPDWRLCIAGYGARRSRRLERLRSMARDRRIAERMHVIELHGDTRGLLERSEIFVQTSHAGAPDLVLFEARDVGCAIVAATGAGTPEMIDFGRAGRQVQRGNPWELAAVLCELMTDPVALATARRDAAGNREQPSADRVAADYEGVYRRAWSS